MNRTNFENLRVYALAEQLADLIYEIAGQWNSFDRTMVGRQVVRSADSIGANIAEGTGRYGIKDNKRFGYYARGSLHETKHWLRRAYKRHLLSPDHIARLKPFIEELSPKLNAYINSIRPVRQARTAKATNNEQRTTN